MKLYIPSKALVSKTATLTGDVASYAATIHFYDAQVTKKPGNLYVKVHVKSFTQDKKTIVLFEISGLPKEQPIWGVLDKINSDFRCGEN